ncbi:MAG: hypothetical protein HY512_04115 [Candidatus Aenigmarchaeota archaeon]|nr:hypothetical protein [Candidatus Aenigmarchaeota archaeon]
MFRKLAMPLLALVIGCSSPTNKYSTMEYTADSAKANRIRVYGGEEFPGRVKLFGNIDLNSGEDRMDLEKFAGRMRFVRPIYNGFGVTGEYKDGSGEDNNVVGVGLSYSPFSGMELRAYPFRTDKESWEFGFSFKKVFKFGFWRPYISSFGDLKLSEGEATAKGEVQAGIKINDVWRVFVEGRVSRDLNGITKNLAAVGFGYEF